MICISCKSSIIDFVKLTSKHEYTKYLINFLRRHGLTNRNKKSVFVGTLFGRIKVPTLRKVCQLMACWLINLRPKTKYVMKDCELSKGYATAWSKRFRRVCLAAYIENSERIGGEGKKVTIYGGKIDNVGYPEMRKTLYTEGQFVFAGIDLESQKTFIMPVKSYTKDYFLAVLREWVVPGSTVSSIFWDFYNITNIKDYVPIHSTVFFNQKTGKMCSKLDYEASYIAEYFLLNMYPPNEERLHAFFHMVAQIYFVN